MIDSIDTILVPQGAEYQAVRRGLTQAGQPKIEIIAIPLGVDRREEYLDRENLGQNLLVLGLCGGLSPQYALGEPVIYRGCYSLEGNFLATDTRLTEAIKKQLPQATVVNSLTSDRPICRAKEKLDLAQRYPTQVVDMEGYGCLQSLQNSDVAVAMVRVVSDDCLDDIPNLELAIEDGKLNSSLLAIAMLRRPLAAIRLIQGSLAGLKTLHQVAQCLR
ncbi:MAG: phosphorylase [Pleurocapsa sp.]